MCRACIRDEQGNIIVRGRRCTDDIQSASKARVNRRIVQKAKERGKHNPVSPNHIYYQPALLNLSFDELKKEIKVLSTRLHEAPVSDEIRQAEIDGEIETKLTSIGMTLASIAEKRIGFDREAFKNHLAQVPEKLKDLINSQTVMYRSLRELQTELNELNNVSKENDLSNEEEFRKNELESKIVNLLVQQEIQSREIEDAGHEWQQRNNKDIHEQITKLVNEYHKIIAEVRSVGGKIGYAKTPDEERDKASRVLAETVGKNYPTEWLEASNKSANRLRLIGNNGGRAKYGHDQVQEDLSPHDYPEFAVEEYEKYYFASIPVDELQDSIEKLGSQAVIVDAPAFTDSNGTFKIIKMPTQYIFESDVDRKEPNINPKDGEPDWKPAGRGWMYTRYINPATNRVSKNKKWVRDSSAIVEKVKMDSLIVSYPENKQNNLSGNGDLPVIDDNQKQTAYHEFAHRAERTVAGGAIMRQEQAFLNRRTVDPDTGVQEDLSYIYPPQAGQSFLSVELGRRNTLPTHYIGKVYIDSPAREVLSVGLESVFGGSYDAFNGLSNDKNNDPDLKGFCLGILAIA